jgi:DNA modification methylase
MAQEIRITCDVKLFIPLENLNAFQGSLKSLSDANYQKLKKQILEEGFCAPVFVWKDAGKYYLLDGHQRTLTCTQMKKDGYKIPDLPAVEIFAKTKLEAKKKLLSYVSAFGKVESQGLYEYIIEAEIPIEDMADFEIPEIDMDEFKAEYFAEEAPAGDGSEDNVPEVAQNELGVKLGDIYQLGEHRLMCGDSTDLATVEKLINGEKVDMVFTDPPYGISYQSNWTKKFEEIKNDDEFLNFKPCLDAVLQKNTPQYIWTSHQVFHIWREFFIENYKSTIIWYKKFGGMGDLKAEYGHNYEMCLYLCNGRAEFSGDRPKAVWEIGADSPEGFVHPTQKPVALAEYALSHHKGKKNILDLFLGSGSTLIACEKTNRKCYGMELDPHYCSVIIKRFEEHTGKKHKKLS